MTKLEVKEQLRNGKTLSDLFEFTEGQDCLIYKADQFKSGEEVIYIPDIYLNEIDIYKVLSDEEIEDIPMYSGWNFVDECDGNEKLAKVLFDWCDWCHPSSALQDVCESYSDEEFMETFEISKERIL